MLYVTLEPGIDDEVAERVKDAIEMMHFVSSVTTEEIDHAAYYIASIDVDAKWKRRLLDLVKQS
jgi:hypothetical protein